MDASRVPDKIKLFETIINIKDYGNYRLTTMEGDGSCLYRALSFLLYKDRNRYNEVKQEIINFYEKMQQDMKNNNIDINKTCKNYIEKCKHVLESIYLTTISEKETLSKYIEHIKKPGTYGGEPEITIFQILYPEVLFNIYNSENKVIYKLIENKVDKINLLHLKQSGSPHYDVLINILNNEDIKKSILSDIDLISKRIKELEDTKKNLEKQGFEKEVINQILQDGIKELKDSRELLNKLETELKDFEKNPIYLEEQKYPVEDELIRKQIDEQNKINEIKTQIFINTENKSDDEIKKFIKKQKYTSEILFKLNDEYQKDKNNKMSSLISTLIQESYQEGGSNTNYKNKYLKYKSKYLKLKRRV